VVNRDAEAEPQQDTAAAPSPAWGATAL